MTKLLDACAHELMDTVPQIMQSVRVEMRRGRDSQISIPQFRAMRFIQRNPDLSLSSLAEHLGLTLPSASKLVDGLVKQKFVVRKISSVDRRKVTLGLTSTGDSLIGSARAKARANLAQKLKNLPDADLQTVSQAMKILHPIFNQSRED